MNSRTRQFLHDEWPQLVVIAVPLLAALVAMPFATERVPMQWNLRGQVNWYAPKEWGLLAVPVIMMVTYGILYWREGLDRYRLNAEDGSLTSHGKTTRTIRLVVSIMVLALYMVQLAAALGRHPDVGRLASALGPFILAVVGNFFGKLKPNGYMGVRVPWTLRSETVWRRTHRVTGWLYTGVGLAAGILCLLLPADCTMQITVTWLAVIMLVPLALAWQAAREERTGQPTTAGITLAWMAAIETVALVGIIALYFQHAADPQHAPQREAAQLAAEKWVVNLDESRYPDAWQATGTHFRKVVPQAKLLEGLNKYRKPLGAMRSRKLREAEYTETLPNGVKGKFVIVQFDTEFERQANAVETVVEVLEKDGKWQMDGYFIR